MHIDNSSISQPSTVLCGVFHCILACWMGNKKIPKVANHDTYFAAVTSSHIFHITSSPPYWTSLTKDFARLQLQTSSNMATNSLSFELYTNNTILEKLWLNFFPPFCWCTTAIGVKYKIYIPYTIEKLSNEIIYAKTKIKYIPN